MREIESQVDLPSVLRGKIRYVAFQFPPQFEPMLVQEFVHFPIPVLSNGVEDGIWTEVKFNADVPQQLS